MGLCIGSGFVRCGDQCRLLEEVCAGGVALPVLSRRALHGSRSRGMACRRRVNQQRALDTALLFYVCMCACQ
jgi:hypothetical protein